jgi:hypothetical protein
MEKQVNATVKAPSLGEFIDDALEGVEQPPAADPSEIVKATFLGEFIDDAAAYPPQPAVPTPGNEAIADRQ